MTANKRMNNSTSSTKSASPKPLTGPARTTVQLPDASIVESQFAQVERLVESETPASEGEGWEDARCEDQSQTATPTLTIVIPVYNEPVTVLEIVDRVRKLPISKQIILVNDGSTDGTRASIDSLQGIADITILHHEQNRGKGAALQTGFERARGDFVIVQDADLEYDPQDILKVIEPLIAKECDVVYGSRYLENALQDPSRLHRLGNRLLTELSNWMTGFRLTDMETCYKAFRRDVLQSIQIEQPRFGFEPEITAKLASRGAVVREVGVSYNCRSRDEGKKIGWKDLVSAIYCILKYRRGS